MKTFSTDGRETSLSAADLAKPADVDDDADAQGPQSPEELAWQADNAEALSAAWPHPRFVTLPGREPTDLEAISDLWLD